MVTQISRPPEFLRDSRIGHVQGLGNNVHVMLLSDLLRRGLQDLLIARAHGDAATLRGERFRRGTANPWT